MRNCLPTESRPQIWGLADLNGDGKMDLGEFSIACKLIKMKLTGYEVPPQLPPSMLAAPSMGGVAMMPQQMGMPGGMMMQQPVMQQGSDIQCSRETPVRELNFISFVSRYTNLRR